MATATKRTEKYEIISKRIDVSIGPTYVMIEPSMTVKKSNWRRAKKLTPTQYGLNGEKWQNIFDYTGIRDIPDAIDFSDATIELTDHTNGHTRTKFAAKGPILCVKGQLFWDGRDHSEDLESLKAVQQKVAEQEKQEERAAAPVYELPYGYELNKCDLYDYMPEKYAEIYFSSVEIEIAGSAARPQTVNEALYGLGTITSITDYGRYLDLIKSAGVDAFIDKVRQDLARSSHQWVSVFNKELGIIATKLLINPNRSGYSVTAVFEKSGHAYGVDINRGDSALVKGADAHGEGSAMRGFMANWYINGGGA